MRPTTVRQRVRPLGVIFRLLLGTSFVASGVGVFAVLYQTRPHTPRTPITERSMPVRIITTQLMGVKRSWPAYGTAQAVQAVDLSAEVTGLVTQRPERINAGATVAKGELIIAIDSQPYDDALTRSTQRVVMLESQVEALDVQESSLTTSTSLASQATKLLRWELDRLKEAQARGAAQDAEVNRMLRELTQVQRQEQDLRQRLDLLPPKRSELQAQISVERANVRLAELDVQRTRIVAPFRGVLADVLFKQGELVTAGRRAARVVDLREIETPLKLAISAAESVHVGDVVELRSGDSRRQRWTGRIARIAPEADPSTRTFTVYVVIKQDPDKSDQPLLTPGQFLTAEIIAQSASKMIIIPRGAIESDRVMVVDSDSRAQPRDVRVSYFIDGSFPGIEPNATQWAAIENGLAPGERVVISNLDDMSAGELIEPSDVAAGDASLSRAPSP